MILPRLIDKLYMDKLQHLLKIALCDDRVIYKTFSI